MSDRGDEGASLLSNTTNDIEYSITLRSRRSIGDLPQTAHQLSAACPPRYYLCSISVIFRFASHFIRYLIAIGTAVLVLVFGLSFAHDPRLPAKLQRPFSNKATYRLERRKGTRIIGLIFLGRRDRVSILDYYLKTILPIVVGGWTRLSGASILMTLMTSRTWTSYCLQTLLTAKWSLTTDQTLVFGTKASRPETSTSNWTTMPSLLLSITLVANTESVVVSTNMINSPELNWLQYRTGATLPYLPDLNHTRSTDLSTTGNP
jgi:hypothetical protein